MQDRNHCLPVLTPSEDARPGPGPIGNPPKGGIDYIPVAQMGTTDDCGFSPFCDDTSTRPKTAFAKIRARVQGTALAAQAVERR